jgi:purine-binding chemotaxis protein CheW
MNQSPVDPKSRRADLAGKYLTFVLGEEEYGISIHHVQEIIGMLPVTPVPGSPSDVLGVINLRGKIVPVTDLRQKFGIIANEATSETCIVVVRAHGIATGIIADRVREVTEVRGETIEAPPSFGMDVDISHVLGIATTPTGARILLDIERVLPAGNASAGF